MQLEKYSFTSENPAPYKEACAEVIKKFLLFCKQNDVTTKQVVSFNLGISLASDSVNYIASIWIWLRED